MIERQKLINLINNFGINKPFSKSIKVFENTFSKFLSNELKFKLSRFGK